jgi:hypothetical protein
VVRAHGMFRPNGRKLEMSSYPETPRVCSNCGKTAARPGHFCTGCGARFAPEHAPIPAPPRAAGRSDAESPPMSSTHAPSAATEAMGKAPPPPPIPQPQDATHLEAWDADARPTFFRSTTAIVAAVMLVVLVGTGAAYMTGAFSSSHKAPGVRSTLAAGGTASTSAGAIASTTSSSSSAPASSSAPTGPPGPSTTLRTYFQELGSDHERAAFSMMSKTYEEQNPTWLSEREEAQPQVNVVSVGSATYSSGSAIVPVEFFARDRFQSRGSDTLCRRFTGTVTMIHAGSQWQYEPDTSKLIATVVPSSNPGCAS